MLTLDPGLAVVILRSWLAHAVVLFDWPMSVDLKAVPVEHPGQRRALTDLLVQLEMGTDVTSVSAARVAVSQAEVVSGVDCYLVGSHQAAVCLRGGVE
jgi:hypothetical protein